MTEVRAEVEVVAKVGGEVGETPGYAIDVARMATLEKVAKLI